MSLETIQTIAIERVHQGELTASIAESFCSLTGERASVVAVVEGRSFDLGPIEFFTTPHSRCTGKATRKPSVLLSLLDGRPIRAA
jgi:hypothetical protein